VDSRLQQLAAHGLFDLRVKAKGDTHIDDHHTNEDVALALGTALLRALGDRKGIRRFGDFTAPLDEALVHVVLVVLPPLCATFSLVMYHSLYSLFPLLYM
jgi:imidazoleglycerol-phosphate dehydratase